MGNPELREMIDLATAAKLVNGAAWALLAAAVVLLLVAMVSRSGKPLAFRLAAALAPAALLVAVGWDIYLARVRFDPVTGFCGLHSVRVFAQNVLGAVIVGIFYGLYLRWLGGLPLEGAPADHLRVEEE